MSTARPMDLTKETSDSIYKVLANFDLKKIEKNWKDISKELPFKKEQLTLIVKVAHGSKDKNDFYKYLTSSETPPLKLSAAEMEVAKGGRIAAYLMAAGMHWETACALNSYWNY